MGIKMSGGNAYLNNFALDLLLTAISNPREFYEEFKTGDSEQKFWAVQHKFYTLRELQDDPRFEQFLFDQDGDLRPKFQGILDKKGAKFNFSTILYLLSDKENTKAIIFYIYNDLIGRGFINVKDLNKTSHMGSLPMIAASKCDIMMLDFLKSHSVNLKYGTARKGNPYSVAERVGCQPVMDFLRRSGVGPSYSKANGTMVQAVPLLGNDIVRDPNTEIYKNGPRVLAIKNTLRNGNSKNKQ